MKIRELRGRRLLIALGITFLTILLAGRIAASAYIEILWFDSLGYSSVFWTRVVWEWGVRLFGALLVGLVFFFNLRFIARALGGIRIKRRVGDLVISEQLSETVVIWSVALLSALVGAWFGASIPPSMGLNVLYLLNAPEWGVTDPFLGRDLTFFVILLPLLRSLVIFGLVVTFLVFTLAAAGYAATGALQWGPGRLVIESRPRVHLGVIIAAFSALLGAQFWLARYVLLLNGTSGVQGIFGFADAEARMPAYGVLSLLALAVSATALWSGFKNRPLPLMVASAVLMVGGLAVGQAYPSFIQRFRVEPNELERESPYILENMRFTRMGFDLTDLERREFDYEQSTSVDWQAAASQFEGLPVWSAQALLTTYRELEARFPYYDFSGVTVDRYEGPDGMVPVALAVREVLPRGIQDPNWQNLHLRDDYIRGMGAVVSAATTRTPEGRPTMFVSGIPPEFAASEATPESLRLTRPDVYVGARRGASARDRLSGGHTTGLAPEDARARLALQGREPALRRRGGPEQPIRLPAGRPGTRGANFRPAATIPRGPLSGRSRGADRLDTGGLHGVELVPPVDSTRPGGWTARPIRPEQRENHRRRDHGRGDLLRCRRRRSAAPGLCAGLSHHVQPLE